MGDMKLPKLRRKKEVEASAPAPIEDIKADRDDIKAGADDIKGEADVAKPKRVTRGRRADDVEQPVASSNAGSFAAGINEPETSFTLIDDDERRRLIAEAAYYRAMGRGFTGGSPETDWLEAEAEIGMRLATGRRSNA